MKHKKTVGICVIVFLICVLIIVWYIESHKEVTTERITINESLIDTFSFAVSSDSAQVHENLTGAVKTKEALTEEIKVQISRSERIIRSFSSHASRTDIDDTVKEEDIAIIDRNETKLQLLNKLLTEIEAVSMDDYDAISEIHDTLFEDVNTDINGTVFVYKSDKRNFRARIIANFNIDSNDWGGIAFYFPEGILVTDIDCSYPQEIPLKERTHNDYINVGYSDESQYHTRVEIARNLNKIPSGGGSGTVLLDFDINKAYFGGGDINFLVGVGFGEYDGVDTDSVQVAIETESQ